MTTKKIISTICAGVFAFSCFGFNVSAKVIEPEIVKTETWTTSYFIDDDMNTLYPYIQCEADIYNDGTIKLYMWNTHEWDGFVTVSSKVTFLCSKWYSEDDIQYKAKYGGLENNWHFNSDEIKNIDLSYYSKYYIVDSPSRGANGDYPSWWFNNTRSDSYISSIEIKRTYGDGMFPRQEVETIDRKMYQTPLASILAFEKRPGTDFNWYYEFKPTVNPTGTYNFRLYGHDITITPELLSGNIVVEPELTEQEKYIKQLEEENSKLKTEIESYKKLDFDGDGLLTNADAQMILVYYTDSLVGKTTGKVEDYSEYVKQISG